MSVIDTLITDRTQSDVDRATSLNSKGFASMTAAEKTEYLAGMKGAYNATDLNRVGEACEYIADRLNNLLGFDIHITPKQDWQIADIPTTAEMDEYLDNIATLRAAYAIVAPSVPSDMEQLTFSEANDIETILIAVDEAAQRVISSFVYSGQTFSGVIWGSFT